VSRYNSGGGKSAIAAAADKKQLGKDGGVAPESVKPFDEFQGADAGGNHRISPAPAPAPAGSFTSTHI
jgi:hypothetical protein